MFNPTIPSVIDLTAIGLCALASFWIYTAFPRRPHLVNLTSKAYILENTVTHARLLPVESKHAFSYPTVALLLSLNALETGELGLGFNRLFRYGDGLSLLSIRPNPYLTAESGLSIRQKLFKLIRQRGFAFDDEAISDTWMLTMPRILGHEGINPLTVYFCFRPAGQLWLTVLEVLLI